MSRNVVKVLLALAGFIAIAVVILGLQQQGGNNPAAWATLSAALAVIAAVVSAWTGQRVVELQEDALAPNPVPWIDLRSRWQLVQFRITNRGATTAHNVRLAWEQPLENSKREQITLGVKDAIPIIIAGDSASVMLGVSHEYINAWKDTTRRGTITFDDATGKHYSRAFVVSAEHDRLSLLDDTERVKTEYELQKIPDALKKIAKELQQANERLANPRVPPP